MPQDSTSQEFFLKYNVDFFARKILDRIYSGRRHKWKNIMQEKKSQLNIVRKCSQIILARILTEIQCQRFCTKTCRQHIQGAKAQDHTMGLGFYIKVRPRPRRRCGCQKAPGPILMGPKIFKRRSEEKCLLGRTKYGSNMHSACYKDPLLRVLVTRMSPTSP